MASFVASGAIVGTFKKADKSVHAFLRKPDGRIADIDDPDAESGTTPAAINDKGAVAGNYTGQDGKVHGFVRTH